MTCAARPIRVRTHRQRTPSCMALLHSAAALLLLLVVVSISTRTRCCCFPYDTGSTENRSSSSGFVVQVEAQHPIIKFLQMHTTHRNRNGRNRNNRNILIDVDSAQQQSIDGSDDDYKDNTVKKEGDDDDINIATCRSIKERLHIVETQLAGSELATKEMMGRYEQLLSEFAAQQKEHTEVVAQLEDTIRTAQTMETEHVELTQRTMQLHHTTTEELQAVSMVLQTLEKEHLSIQQQHDTITKELQQSFDTVLDESAKECQSRIDTMQAMMDQRTGLQSDKSTCTGEMNVLETQLHRAEMKYERILKEYDVSLQQYIQEHFDSAVQNQTDIAVSVVQVEYDAYQNDCRKSLQQLQNEIQNMTQTFADSKQVCTAKTEQLQEQMFQQKKMLEEEYVLQQVEYSNVLGQTQTIYDDNIKKLRQSLEQQHNDTIHSINASHARTILEYDTATTNRMIEQNATLQSLLESHNDTITDYVANIERMTMEHKTTITDREIQFTTLTNQYDAVVQELQQEKYNYEQLLERYDAVLESSQYWETLFHQRSYVNMTHILQDVYVYSTQQLPLMIRDTYIQPLIVQPTQQFYSDMQQYYQIHIMQQRIVPFISHFNTWYHDTIVTPYLIPSHQYYTLHLQPTVVKGQHVYVAYGHPYVIAASRSMSTKYQHYIVPPMLRMYDTVVEFYTFTILDGFQNVYDESIHHYRTMKCPQLIQSMMTTTTTNTVTTTKPRNDVALRVIQYTCDYPHDAILQLLKFVVSVIVIVFHQSILRFVWCTVQVIVVFVLWDCNPIRILYNVLVIRRKTDSSTMTTYITDDDIYIDHNNNDKNRNGSMPPYQNGSTAQK